MLATGSRDQTVRLWSLPDGALNKTLDGHRGGVNYLAISPNGALMASGSKDKTVWLWDLPHGVLIRSLEGHDNLVTCLAISPDGRLMASGSYDQTVRLWSLPDGSPIKTLDGHRHMVSCLTISPDGRLVASGSWDNTVRLWTLNPIRLCNLPIAGASLADFEWIQKTLSGGKLAGSERRALEFMSALMQRRLKFDIVVEETPQRIKVREFDIEIEG